MPDSKFLTEFSDWKHGNFLEDHIDFPKRTGININMMPYISKGNNFEEYKLPAYVKPYFSFIYFCGIGDSNYDPLLESEKIFYLTIQEGWVEPKKSQRRPGIYTDNTGCITITKCTVSPEGDECYCRIQLGSGQCGGGSRSEDGREGGI